MGAGDIAGDGQAQARAAGLQIAAFIQAVKGPEGFFAPAFRYAGAVIFHRDFGKALVARQRHRHLAAMLEGIVHQIGDAAAQRRALDA